MKVLFIAAEADPFVKVGGLADVAGSLPLAIRSLPLDVRGSQPVDIRLIIPRHPGIEVRNARASATLEVPHRGGTLLARVFETRLQDIVVYLVDGQPIALSESVYSEEAEADADKYTFFSLAAARLGPSIGWEPDILHANDWHASLSIYAAAVEPRQSATRRPATLLTVHNLGFVGPDLTSQLEEYHLANRAAGLPRWAKARALPLGIWGADAIVAVSPTYAAEILTKGNGAGLEGFLRGRRARLQGILNGIDQRLYDPATDSALGANFSLADIGNRGRVKANLQARLGLLEDREAPLLAIISRLEHQKGIDLVFEALREPRIVQQRWKAVILGVGSREFETSAQQLQRDFPNRVRAEIRFDSELARQIYGGADLLLMPSRYEPCGLSQMIAMRYGCLPLVRATGGLRDTVVAGKTGFTFEKATSRALGNAMRTALMAFRKPEEWARMQRAAMNQDFSWDRSAALYYRLYESLLR